MMRAAFNPDNAGDSIFRTIKATQQNQSFANFMHTGSFGATGIIEIYETTDQFYANRCGISPTIKAVIFKAGVSNIIMREDGFNHPGIIEIYEVNTFSNTE